MTLEAWLNRHSYLAPLARLAGRVDGAAARIETVRAEAPRWDSYARDFQAGVPLLHSPEAEVDLEAGGRRVVELVSRLSAAPLTGGPAAELALLNGELRRDADAARRVAAWLLGDDAFVSSAPGLLRYLGWRAMTMHLAPMVAAFDAWRGEDRWLRRYCPTCGSAPAMAQLIDADQSRKRLLVCGCCGSRWSYSRTSCPFCESDTQRLAVVAIEGEAGLRIDYCESCRGYLKTYAGSGDEAVLLSDWTSLHLDVLAQDRGLKRLAASLYDLEAAAPS